MTKVKDIIDLIEEFAPSAVSADWDNVGLQVGREDSPVDAVLVALDVTQEVIKEAVDKGANLIVAHHPVTTGEIRTINSGDFTGGRLWLAANLNVNIFVAHTNLDVCPGGVNDVLAEKLELEDIEILFSSKGVNRYKLVCFLPSSHIKEVTEAIVQAGGGVIGDYTHCTFRTAGRGTFKPGPESKPFVKISDSINEVEEIRLETVVTGKDLQSVLTGMLEAHPYEEVAYDVYKLEEPRASFGLGRIGKLRKQLPLDKCVEIWQKNLGTKSIRVCGDLSQQVERVAVCGGSGSDLIPVAKERGAQVFVTGDVKYHDAQLADFLGLAIVDAGHYHTERVIVPKLASLLEQKLKDKKETVKVLVSQVDTNPWHDQQVLE